MQWSPHQRLQGLGPRPKGILCPETGEWVPLPFDFRDEAAAPFSEWWAAAQKDDRVTSLMQGMEVVFYDLEKEELNGRIGHTKWPVPEAVVRRGRIPVRVDDNVMSMAATKLETVCRWAAEGRPLQDVPSDWSRMSSEGEDEGDDQDEPDSHA